MGAVEKSPVQVGPVIKVWRCGHFRVIFVHCGTAPKRRRLRGRVSSGWREFDAGTGVECASTYTGKQHPQRHLLEARAGLRRGFVAAVTEK